MAEKEQVQTRKGREGARWINERPSPEDFAAWAKENISLHEGLDIADYLGGIVLIPSVEKKAKYVAGFTPQGEPRIGERPEMTYTPYAKVETRLQYYWDLLEVMQERWIGVLQPIVTERPELSQVSEVVRELPSEEGQAMDLPTIEREVYKPATTAAIVHQLPPGFFLLPIPVGGEYTYYLCCSYHVAIYERDGGDRPIREGRGTKQVALLGKGWNDSVVVDANAIMKAETGAMGRALGAAGIFTIPGSGIATAEDMLDAAAAGPSVASAELEEGAGPAAPAEAAAPAAAAEAPAEAIDSDEGVLAGCKEIMADLQENHKTAYAAFGEWCNKRRPKIVNLAQLEGPALRGVHTKLKRLQEVASARDTPAAVPPEGAPSAATASADAQPPPDVQKPAQSAEAAAADASAHDHSLV